MSKLIIKNSNWPTGNGYVDVSELGTEYTYLKGSVQTPHGIVEVVSQGDKMNPYYTRLDFVKDGQTYTRTFNRRYSKRGLGTKAREFAKEIDSQPGVQ